MPRFLMTVMLLAIPILASAQSEFRVAFRSDFDFTLIVKDVNGNDMPNLLLALEVDSLVGEGGHNHGVVVGGTLYRLGRISRTTCNTGFNSRLCTLNFASNDGGGEVRIKATIQSGPQAGQVFIMQQPILISALSGFDMPLALENYGSSDFDLVGQTVAHTDNHYCVSHVCDGAVQLAQDYLGSWGRILAYNDVSLRKGGRFDINSDYRAPHSEHMEGRNIDVRANGGSNSIPEDPTIRNWFIARVIAIFGVAPLHEGDGTSNEHYHIRG